MIEISQWMVRLSFLANNMSADVQQGAGMSVVITLTYFIRNMLVSPSEVFDRQWVHKFRTGSYTTGLKDGSSEATGSVLLCTPLGVHIW